MADFTPRVGGTDIYKEDNISDNLTLLTVNSPLRSNNRNLKYITLQDIVDHYHDAKIDGLLESIYECNDKIEVKYEDAVHKIKNNSSNIKWTRDHLSSYAQIGNLYELVKDDVYNNSTGTDLRIHPVIKDKYDNTEIEDNSDYQYKDINDAPIYLKDKFELKSGSVIRFIYELPTTIESSLITDYDDELEVTINIGTPVYEFNEKTGALNTITYNFGGNSIYLYDYDGVNKITRGDIKYLLPKGSGDQFKSRILAMEVVYYKDDLNNERFLINGTSPFRTRTPAATPEFNSKSIETTSPITIDWKTSSSGDASNLNNISVKKYVASSSSWVDTEYLGIPQKPSTPDTSKIYYIYNPIMRIEIYDANDSTWKTYKFGSNNTPLNRVPAFNENPYGSNLFKYTLNESTGLMSVSSYSTETSSWTVIDGLSSVSSNPEAVGNAVRYVATDENTATIQTYSSGWINVVGYSGIFSSITDSSIPNGTLKYETVTETLTYKATIGINPAKVDSLGSVTTDAITTTYTDIDDKGTEYYSKNVLRINTEKPGTMSVHSLDIIREHYDNDTLKLKFESNKSILYVDRDALKIPDIMPIGSFTWWFGSEKTIPDGWLICDGRKVEVSKFPRLAEVLGTKYNLPGENITTSLEFHIPNLLDGFPFVMAGNTTEIGTKVVAGLPNIKGSFTGAKLTDYADDKLNYGTGAFYREKRKDWSSGGGDSGYNSTFHFDASRFNSIYGNSTTVQPPAIKALPLIKALDTLNVASDTTLTNGISSVVEANSSNIASIRTKLDKTPSAPNYDAFTDITSEFKGKNYQYTSIAIGWVMINPGSVANAVYTITRKNKKTTVFMKSGSNVSSSSLIPILNGDILSGTASSDCKLYFYPEL